MAIAMTDDAQSNDPDSSRWLENSRGPPGPGQPRSRMAPSAREPSTSFFNFHRPTASAIITLYIINALSMLIDMIAVLKYFIPPLLQRHVLYDVCHDRALCSAFPHVLALAQHTIVVPIFEYPVAQSHGTLVPIFE